MTASAPELSFREVLRIRAIRRLWLAQVVSSLGDYLALFAVLSIVTFNLHGTANQVSMLMAVYLLPIALVSPVAGVLIDRWNVKWAMIGSDLVRSLLVLGLMWSSNITVICCIFLLLSTISSLFTPAQTVAIQAITPKNGLMAANALMAQASQIMPIVVPGIAGLMVQYLGANACFLFDSFSFLFSAGMVLAIVIQRDAVKSDGPENSFVSMLREGVAFAFTSSTMSLIIGCITASTFALRCFGALLSVYVRDVLASRASLFGTLNSLIGIGMILGTQVTPRLARNASPKQLVIYGLSGMGLSVFATALFASVGAAVIAMLALAVCGKTRIFS